MSNENTYGAAIGTGILAQEVGSVIPGAVNAITDTSGLVYNTGGRYDINTQSRLAIRSDGDINHNIIFHGPGGKEVGRMDFNDGDFKFEGDASEAAKVFIEWCRRNWSDLRAKDKAEVLQQVIDDMMHEASGELYSEDEKVAILTCMQLAQKRRKEHEAPQVAERYSVNLAKSMAATKEAVTQSVWGALAPEGKSL
jgi:hypothetical protein